MDKQHRRNKLSTITGLAALLPLCLFPVYVQAQATVDPATQPPLLLAPYVLETTNLEPSSAEETGGTKAYRPWFENGSWTGDLIQYQITKDGVRTRSEANPTGRYPRDGAGWNDFVELWTARYVFPDYLPYDIDDEVNPEWECKDAVLDYWKTRNIITFKDGVSPTEATTPFLWSDISPEQRSIIDPELAALPPVDVTGLHPSKLLNFVRGDRSNERCKKEGEGWRWRFSLLGAIINSEPVYVPPTRDESELLVAPGVVVVGANGGMLHGFDARNGEELFGYVPSMLMPSLNRLTQRSSRLFYFVDGSLRYRNIGSESPRNVVTGGLGAGGRGLYALDVTNSENPTILFELSGEAGDFNGGTYNSRMGHVHGRPTIARLPVDIVDGKQIGAWYVVSGNGFGSEDGRAYLTLVPIDGGQTRFLQAGVANNNGLSPPALVDATGNGIVDYVYAGDLKGDLWRFDFRGKTITSSEAVPSAPFFSAGEGKPITVEPDVAQHPILTGHMVYFGTGSLLSRDDAIVTNGPSQSIYGIWDNGDRTSIPEGQLVPQNLESLTYEWQVPEVNSCGVASTIGSSKSTVRYITDQKPVNWAGTGQDQRLGWKVDLLRDGERLVTRPQVRAERLQFITTNPLDMLALPAEEDRDPAAGSWMLQLDLETGAVSERSPRPLFDLNKNCTLDQDDSVLVDSQRFFPVGLNLGPFNIAPPSFARVRAIVDGVYINALQLPPQEDIGLPFEGPLDVTTDVPPDFARLRPQYFDPDNNLLDEFYPEPVKMDTGTPRREEPSARAPIKPYLRLTTGEDPPGNRVAGHSSGYNKVHGVPYIDFISLEPRAGDVISERVSYEITSPDHLLRLDVGTEYSSPPDGELKPMNPRRAHRELYRATDVIDDLDQKFIVVVTNADLSAANEIQIGCRTWNVYEYQTMTMQFLRPQAGGDPGLDLTGFVDQQGQSLVVSLREILDETCTGLPTKTGTLRITPRGRVGNPDDMLGTLPGCVNNTHLYDGGLKNDALIATASQLFATAPHVTRNFDPATNSRFDGYRWRNGALTVQLLAVAETVLGTGAYQTDYQLQHAAHLPTRAGGLGEGLEIGWGGIYALGFTISGNNIVPSTVANGLLYESSVFWHWGDMTRFTTRGVGGSVLPGCYGDRPPTTLFNRETSRFQQREYDALTEGFTIEQQMAYASALRDLTSSDPTTVQRAIEFLETLLNVRTDSTGAQKDLTLGEYHRLRYYVPNNERLDLLSIDSGVFELDVDGTPVDVADVERDLLPSLGPNYQPGRRSWMDLTPEN